MLDKAVAGLSGQDRETVLPRFYLVMTVREIAEDQGIAANAAETNRLSQEFSADEEPVLFAHRRGADGVLDGVVVDFHIPVTEEDFELRPNTAAALGAPGLDQ